MKTDSTDGLGVGRIGNSVLCYAWGETDRPDVRLAKTAAEVRNFFISEEFGEEVDPLLDERMQELAAHDWREGAFEVTFEVGGIRLEDVFED